MENPCRIACFGDSITLSWAPLFADRIRDRFADKAIDTLNMGVVSDTSVQAMARLPKVIDADPNVVLLAFGMNDWRKGVERGLFKSNLMQMATALLSRGIRLLFLTITPDGHDAQRVSGSIPAYNQEIKEVARYHGCRVVDLFAAFREKVYPLAKGLYDEIHPNEVGNQAIVDELIDIVPLSQTVIVWTFNGEHCFCNYDCPYCYVPAEINSGHAYDGRIDRWYSGFRDSFGNSRLVFYLSFGEPMAGRGFYGALEMIASESTWQAHITSNLSLSLRRLLETRLVREGRLQVNASFHPSQTDLDTFMGQLNLLRRHGIEPSVIYVMYPAQIEAFAEFFAAFNEQRYFVHVRRFRGSWQGKPYPQSYTEAQRRTIARYCDRLTVRYMLNDFEDQTEQTAARLSYAGINYLMVDERGDVWRSPDFKGRRSLGNLLAGDFHPPYRPSSYGGSFLGSVNIVASLKETGIYQLEGNHTWSFAQNGGFAHHTDGSVYYPLMDADFDDPRLQSQLHWPVQRGSSG